MLCHNILKVFSLQESPLKVSTAAMGLRHLKGMISIITIKSFMNSFKDM